MSLLVGQFIIFSSCGLLPGIRKHDRLCMSKSEFVPQRGKVSGEAVQTKGNRVKEDKRHLKHDIRRENVPQSPLTCSYAPGPTLPNDNSTMAVAFVVLERVVHRHPWDVVEAVKYFKYAYQVLCQVYIQYFIGNISANRYCFPRACSTISQRCFSSAYRL
jgi:hypothetical protein